MHTRPVRLIPLVLIALVTVAIAGCGPKKTALPTISGVPTSTVEATSTDDATDIEVSSGQIVTPATGTALRNDVLAAIASALATRAGKLTVIQLFVQGGAAVGDVKTPSGSRWLVALTGGRDAWTVTWRAPFGSSSASVARLLDAAPEVSTDLVAKLDFEKKVAKPAKAPSLSSFKSYALKSAQSMAEGTYDGTFTVQAQIAQDDAGEWWGNALLEPADEGLEWIGVWGHYTGGKWTGQIADYSEEDADAGFFPEEVLPVLRF